MTAETVHPKLTAAVALLEEELLQWVNEPGDVHVTCRLLVINGVPRKVLELGGIKKDRPI